MNRRTFTPMEFLAYASKRQWAVHGIKKELTPGAWRLIGFEFGRRSSKRRFKFLFSAPIVTSPPTKEKHEVAIIDIPANATAPQGTQPTDGPDAGGTDTPATAQRGAGDHALERGAERIPLA